MLALLIFFVGFANLALSFPFPEECGINYVSPDNIQNASRFVISCILPLKMRERWYRQDCRGLRGSAGLLAVAGLPQVPPWAQWPALLQRQPDQWPVAAIGRTLLLRQGGAGGLGGRDTVEEGWEQVMAEEKIIIHSNYSPPNMTVHSG